MAELFTRTRESKEFFLNVMTGNKKDMGEYSWNLGYFPFEVEGVRHGIASDNSTPEERATDLKARFPDLAAINEYLAQIFPNDKKARARAVKADGVACANCQGELIEINVPNHTHEFYLNFLYSPDCARGAQLTNE